MEVCIQILKANIYMQMSQWSIEEKAEFWKDMELKAAKFQQVLLPNDILMKDVKGYPETQPKTH